MTIRSNLIGWFPRSIDSAGQRRGSPAYLRIDHGPKLVDYAREDWYRFNDTESVFIDPGLPWKHAWIKSLIATFRSESLRGWQLDSPLEARVIIEDWRIDYHWKRTRKD